MSDLTITSEAPGKIILLGEYAVLEGAPALVSSANRYCQVHIAPRPGSVFEFNATNLELPVFRFQINREGSIELRENSISRPKILPAFVLSVLNYVARHAGKNIPGAVCEINTGGFYHPTTGDKLGLGSSAAVTVALLHALNELIKDDSWMKSLFIDALQAHRTGQERMGSGIDIAASVYGGILQYQMSTQESKESIISPLQWPNNLHMLVIWTGNSASTRALVHQVNLFRETEPVAYDTIIKEMCQVAEEGAAAFYSNDIDGFLDLIPRFAGLEMKLGNSSGTDIVSKAHKKLVDLIQREGGVYKPSGAGGGDIGIAFCKHVHTLEQLRKVIGETSFEILDLTVELEGVKLIQKYEIN